MRVPLSCLMGRAGAGCRTRRARAARTSPAGPSRVRPVRRPGASALDDHQDVLLADDEVLLAVDLELGARVLRVEHLVAHLDVHRLALAVVVQPTRPRRDDGALLGLLLGGVRQHDAALGHLLAGSGLDDDTVAERAKRGRSGGRQRVHTFRLCVRPAAMTGARSPAISPAMIRAMVLMRVLLSLVRSAERRSADRSARVVTRAGDLRAGGGACRRALARRSLQLSGRPTPRASVDPASRLPSLLAASGGAGLLP